MTIKEQDQIDDSTEQLDPEEREQNQRRYDGISALLEGNASVEITTATHTIKVEPENFCERDGGCLELTIKPLIVKRVVPFFNYHVNRFSGIVDIAIFNLEIRSIDFGIPGGGAIGVDGQADAIDFDPDNPIDFEELNWGKLSEFVMQQAAIGKKESVTPSGDAS